ncbi:MAG: hypothetical protein Nkreftii_002777 [Candidatus Nitrospira kreftii]|uniref:Uncharacterized protein n=1 Tax=Candidatus Nitrospira kreftii TaxID=2652173 RepID=A0A7S8FFS9_9BACT|nr:MAG: hypothetical protein Nkreftii_002777 [Candidatus Nitrospira kreftii]
MTGRRTGKREIPAGLEVGGEMYGRGYEAAYGWRGGNQWAVLVQHTTLRNSIVMVRSRGDQRGGLCQAGGLPAAPRIR